MGRVRRERESGEDQGIYGNDPYLTIIARAGLPGPGSSLISASHSFPPTVPPSSVPAYTPFPLPSLARSSLLTSPSLKSPFPYIKFVSQP